MRRNWSTVILWTLPLIGLCGCGGEAAAPEPAVEQNSPPASGARTLSIPSVRAQAGTTTTQRAGLIWDLPAGWTEVAPSSNMRLAQYNVAGSGGDGECVVFYFGPGQGGDPASNARRWAGQFAQPDGGDSLERMTMQELDGAPIGLTLVEVTGTYNGGMTSGPEPATPQPGWMLLGGIAMGPDAPWFFKLTGPEATLEENRDAFVEMLRSIRQEI